MVGKKRTFTLEWVSDDGASFSAKDDAGRRTMGRTVEPVHFQIGEKVHLQEHGKEAYYLHKVRTGDEGFLMVDAEEKASGPGCSAERPGGKYESRGSKTGPVAMMTATELLRSAGATDTMVGGAEATEWEERGHGWYGDTEVRLRAAHTRGVLG